MSTEIIAEANPFTYRGYYYDRTLDMYYLKSRYYDYKQCRFISPDNVAYLDPQTIGGMNLYAYCLNNPVMGYDPEGTSWSSFWNGVGDWFKTHFGFAMYSSLTISKKENILGTPAQIEQGYSTTTLLSGNDDKTIVFYINKPEKWWKFFDYSIGVKVNGTNGGSDLGIGLGNVSISIGSGDNSFELFGGWNGIGIGTSHTVSNNENAFVSSFIKYSIDPIRTIMTVLLGKLLGGFKSALPSPIAI